VGQQFRTIPVFTGIFFWNKTRARSLYWVHLACRQAGSKGVLVGQQK